MSAVRILLADDHGIVRKGLHLILDRHGFEVVGDAADGREVVRLAEELKPNLVIMDIGMPQLNGIDATAQIVHHDPRVGIIILSMHSDEGYLVRALSAGVSASPAVPRDGTPPFLRSSDNICLWRGMISG